MKARYVILGLLTFLFLVALIAGAIVPKDASSDTPAAAMVEAPAHVADKSKQTPGAPIHGKPGLLHICLLDDAVSLRRGEQLIIPATTEFEDHGPIKGNIEDPAGWADGGSSLDSHAELITLAPITLTTEHTCADASVATITNGAGWTASSVKSQSRHLFTIDDILSYPIPSKKPPIEMGQLVDDIGLKGMLLTDVSQSKRAPQDNETTEKQNAACLEQAKRFAAYLGAGIGRQSDIAVFLGNVPASDASYGCAKYAFANPALSASWEGSARPPAKTLTFMATAGAYLTGVPQKEVAAEIKACIHEALKPASNELADREFYGSKIECQAFTRDGGAGTVTIYRRFRGPYTPPIPTASQIAQSREASHAVEAAEKKAAADNRAFAQWWLDKNHDKEIKAALFTRALLVATADHCKNPKIAENADATLPKAGLAPEDVAKDGKYFNYEDSLVTLIRAKLMMDKSGHCPSIEDEP